MLKIQKNVLLGPYTTLRVGGPAKYFAETNSIDEIQEFSVWARDNNIPIFVLGGGSNVLFSDKGYDGLVIKPKILYARFEEDEVYVGAGLMLPELVMEFANKGLSGMEWAIGIPGTIGGAIYGNAGSFGGQISNIVKSVWVLNLKDLSISELINSECAFGYHESIFKNLPELVILGAFFNFKKSAKHWVLKNIKENIKKRLAVQPIKQNSAGCFFKNVDWKRSDIDKEKLITDFPELKQFSEGSGVSTKFLIDQVGLKGKKIGDAIASSHHPNFIINSDNATAEQIMMLVSLIKDKIYSHYGFVLEEEVQLIGF